MKFYFSPVSEEAMEAVYATAAACRELDHAFGFCASIGQVGPKNYTGLTDSKFALLRRYFEREYGVHVDAERDHLGRNGENVHEYIDRDAYFGFEECMLHTHYDSEVEAAWYQGRRERMLWQVGPGEDDSKDLNITNKTLTENQVRWFSFPTGCLIMGMGNRGEMNYDQIHAARRQLPVGVQLRAHNCDYLPQSMTQIVKKHFDGMNIAPQIGCIQSNAYSFLADSCSVDLTEWRAACLNDTVRQERWELIPTEATRGIGHYHYDKLPEKFRSSVRSLVLESLVVFMMRIVKC